VTHKNENSKNQKVILPITTFPKFQ